VKLWLENFYLNGLLSIYFAANITTCVALKTVPHKSGQPEEVVNNNVIKNMDFNFCNKRT